MNGRVARVRLRKNLARAIKRGHPWIYRDALAPPGALSDGAQVVVTAADGRALARGFWDARSPIAVRVLAASGAAADVDALIDGRIQAALDRRLAFIDRARTDAFRWIHGEADGLPGIHVDLYGAAASVRHDGQGARAFYNRLGGGPARLGERLLQAARGRGIALVTVVERDGTLLAGAAPPAGDVEVRENGLRFGVDLRQGAKGGLFLDQRDNRARVGALARGCRVLNLFGYTGGFSIYAAAGGALETTTVDVAAPAIAAARDNFARNGLPLERAHFVAGDAFDYLERAARQSADGAARFELVISDPPSFAPSGKALERALGAYKRLHRLAAAVTTPGGRLCAASCSSHVGREAFLRTVEEGAAAAGRRFVLESVTGAGLDHPTLPAFPEGDYLKFAVGTV
jgi:23S rRNA (cytosine1962-C5)-methyltransferase